MIRVLDHYWHAAHGARLVSIAKTYPDIEWTYLVLGDRQPWNWQQREMPEHLRLAYRYEPGRYDVAILHLDQWCADETWPLRGAEYRMLDTMIRDIPKIVIMHGLPEGESNRSKILRLLGDNWMVTNTQMSADMWAAERRRAILPGYDVDEWGPATFEREEGVAVVAGSHTARDHHGAVLLKRMQRDLPIVWVGHDVRFDTFKAYRDCLAGARVLFNPTQWSQHPGSRNEAMLTGLPIVSTCFLDESRYITHGVEGFLSNDYLELRNCLAMLLSDLDLARQMGAAARETARTLFNAERYAAEWRGLLQEVVNAAR